MKKLLRSVEKHGGLEDTRNLGVGMKRDCSFGKGEATFIQVVEGAYKKCRKVCRCNRYKTCRRGKEAGSIDYLECSTDMKSRKQAYYQARGAAKRAIFKVKDAERKKFCEDLEGEGGKGMCSCQPSSK